MLIYLTSEFNPTGVPYSRTGDPSAHSYVRLKEHPELIEELPEPSREHMLRQAILALNSADSVLETVGCETWETDGEFIIDQGEQVEVFGKGSYIAMIFSDERLGEDCGDWFNVFMHLADAVKEEAEQGSAMRIEFRLKPFRMIDGSRQGWQLELWVLGKWRTKEAARKLWEGFLAHIIPLVIEIAAKLQGHKLTAQHDPS